MSAIPQTASGRAYPPRAYPPRAYPSGARQPCFRQPQTARGLGQVPKTQYRAEPFENGSRRYESADFRFVSGNYKNSQPNAVALFLKNAEPGQKNRFLRYTRCVNASNREVVKDLEKQQKALAVQEQKINNEFARLKKIQANVQSLLKKQGVTDAAEQTESRRQNAKIAKDA